MKKILCFLCVLLLVCSVFSSCSGADIYNETESAKKGDAIGDMESYITDNDIRIDSIILIKDGKTLEEVYFNGTVKDTPAPVYSCTKSVMSALVGIAIGEGYIESVNETLPDLLDMENTDISDEAKKDITLKDLLTMSSGLDTGTSDGFVLQDDAVGFILEQPMASEPGKVFEYTSGGPHVVSAILQQATGMETSEYAQVKLFDPLGIQKPYWSKDNQGLAMGGFGLELTPRQLADFGCLYLNGGMWNGKRVIPAGWISESTSRSIDTDMPYSSEQCGYGYYWWMNDFGGYSAHGYSGQYLFVLPEQNAVAVFTSQLDEADFDIPYKLMKDYVMPYLKGY